MKAFLIDPFKQNISEVDYNGDWKTIKTHIECDMFTVVKTPEGDIFLDDEGLYSKGNEQMFFFYEGYPTPLAGYGLVLDSDYEGESIASTTSIEELSRNINWLGGPYETMLYAKKHQL